jgi:predicted transposase YbfD/YdcC
MMARTLCSLTAHFASLQDPRLERTRKHQLLDILAIALSAIICGADSWVHVALYGTAKHEWLKTFLTLPNGIPSHDTFGRLFALLNPEQFQDCFRSWMAEVATQLGLKQVAIDGKTLRGSHDRGKGKAALHLVSAWATENHLSLGQEAVDTKSNEITAIPKLLAMLDLGGALVTIDAMGCQKDIAKQIRQQEADYLLTVKENQPGLYRDIEQLDEKALERDYEGIDNYAEEEKSHGREELRACWVLEDLSEIRDRDLWPDLKSVIVVVRERTVGDKNSCEKHYYISNRQASAELFLRAIRGHWGIENGLHWVLDVTFDEDGSRVRKDHGPENFGLLRRLAVSMLKKAGGGKGSIRGKRLTAGWNDEFMESVLLDFIEN